MWGTASTSTVEILEYFQLKALRMMVVAPSCVENTIIRKDLDTHQQLKKNLPLQPPIQYSPQRTPKRPNSDLIEQPNDNR
jgi:hypothetical protein